MEVLKGYGRFLLLVAVNAGLLTVIAIKILEVSSLAGWEVVGCVAICLFLLVVYAGVFYITGSVTGEEFND